MDTTSFDFEKPIADLNQEIEKVKQIAEKTKVKKRSKFGTLASISAALLSIGFIAQFDINNVSKINENLIEKGGEFVGQLNKRN